MANKEGVKRKLFDPPQSGSRTVATTLEEIFPYLSSKPTTDPGGDGTDFSTEEVCQHLKEHNVSYDIINRFRENRITQLQLDAIDEAILHNMGIEDPNDQKKVLSVLKKVSQPAPMVPMNYKIFNDPIHGHIELNDLLLSIIDTSEFQRLRWIKQLGISYLVYPGASHNRFEHSLGVAHLAGEFARTLRKYQPELKISDVDILCVEIAGLCHDLGHGPFSHLFDNKFMPVINRRNGVASTWKHEDASLKMFDHLVEKNERVNVKFAAYSIHERDVLFIKELIRGPLGQDKEYIGRPKEKRFLYEIVSNKRTEIDVDKWDYFARDCYHLGINKTFDHKRFMHFCRVINWKICCRDKEAKNLYDMFLSRANLHRMAYQHKTNQNLENMLVQALVKANDHLTFTGTNNQKYKMSECWQDMEAYSKLADNIFFDILSSSDPKLAPAREVLLRIQRRELYRFVGETRPTKDALNDAIDCRDAIADLCKNINPHVDFKDELVGQTVSLDFGRGNQNPLENMSFYSKGNLTDYFFLKKSDVSMMLPQSFMEVKFRLYCKSYDTSVHDVAAQGFNQWCAENNYPAPKMCYDFTPTKKDDRSVSESPAPKRSKLALN